MQNGPKPIMSAHQPRRAAWFAARSKRWTPSAARPEPKRSQNAQRNHERYLALARAEAQNGNTRSGQRTTMKRFADGLVRQRGIKPPPGYKTSISICRKFLNEHAPKKAESEALGKLGSKPVSPAQMLYAKKVAQGKGIVIPEEAKA